jgi:hypothetical protein
MSKSRIALFASPIALGSASPTDVTGKPVAG